MPQVTLWERWRKRAASASDTLFFRAEPFFQADVERTRAPGGAVRATHGGFRGVLTPEEMAYCEAKLAAFYPGYPRFEQLRFERGDWTAVFRNSAADATPSSVMRGDHKRIMLVGRGADKVHARVLPFSLAVMIKLWVGEFRRPTCAEWDEVDLAAHIPPAVAQHEQEFAREATDLEAASRQVRRALRRAVRAHPISLVCAPEGIKKTTSLFEDHHRTQGAIAAQSGASLSMYAFSDYDAAQEKCAAFNGQQQQRRDRGGNRIWHGVVIPSFSRAYEDACAAMQVARLSPEDAARAGYRTLWDAVAGIQPEVLEKLKIRHRAIWDEVGARIPVFFTVHDVAHRWTLQTPTRVMWARGFWIGRMDDAAHVRACRRATALGLLVHDEVDPEDLVALHRAEVVEWVAALRNTDPKLWSGRRASLAAQLRSYTAHLAHHPHPQVGGATCAISFHDAREIAALGAVEWDQVTTRCSGEYGDGDDANDIYAGRSGRHWFVAPRNWWSGVAERILVLTTEAVPTEVARCLAPRWATHELATPLLPRDSIDTHPQRSITAGTLIKGIRKYREREGATDRVVISNRASALSNTITHTAARGSNAFIGLDLAQTMTFFRPTSMNAWKR